MKAIEHFGMVEVMAGETVWEWRAKGVFQPTEKGSQAIEMDQTGGGGNLGQICQEGDAGR